MKHTVPVFFMLLAGCGGDPVQSALHPVSDAAAKTAALWWVMCGVFGAVFALVILLLLYAIFRRADERAMPPLGGTGFLVAGGIVLPAVILLPLYILSLETSAALRQPDDAMTVRVVGHQWWWEVFYPDDSITIANEIYVAAGRPVRLELTSADVIHSFWVPRLAGKRDLIPGIQNEFWIQADVPGAYRGQCAEYCGTQHAKMAFHVIALPPDEFAVWLEARRVPREADLARDRGLSIFLKAGCAQCHTIRGTEATGRTAPDLTHIGSRRTLGAGTLPNTRGHLTGWIADAQALKPGIKMPRSHLASDDLIALANYLESLK